MKKKLYVILADDDIDDRYFFEKALELISVPTDFLALEDGEQLMAHLFTAQGIPDVIFLDINMPRKNGQECLTEIKADPKLKNIPVIMYSTCMHDEVADQLYRTGATFYIRKTDFTDLPRLLETALTVVSKGIQSQPPRDQFILNAHKFA